MSVSKKPLSLSVIVAFAGVALDRAGTLRNAEAAFDALEKSRSEERKAVEAMAGAVNAVYDRKDFKGTNIQSPALRTYVLTALNAQPGNYAALETALKTFISENSADTRAEGKLLKVTKGPGGGVRRWSDIALTEEEKKAAAATPAPTSEETDESDDEDGEEVTEESDSEDELSIRGGISN